MVYPKPGLFFNYGYDIPDHLRRKRKWRNRDYTKIYDLLSDDDLYDIRGPGLVKVSDEDSKILEKEAEENGTAPPDKNKTAEAKPAASNAKKPTGRKRASLMRQMKKRQESKEEPEPLPEEKKEDTKVEVEQKEVEKKEVEQKEVEQKEVEQIVIVKKKSVKAKVRKTIGKKKVPVRGKKRKAVGSIKLAKEEAKITVPIIQVQARDESSKENESEGTSGTELQLSPNRIKEPPVQEKLASTDIWKNWRRSSSTPIGSLPGLIPEKQFTLSEEDNDSIIGTKDRMDSGKVEVKLSALNEFSGSLDYVKATWPKAKAPKKKAIKKRDPFLKPPTLLGPFSIVGPAKAPAPQKKRSYKKRAPFVRAPAAPALAALAPSAPKKRKSTKGIKKPRRPIEELTSTQILRRVRYAIDKYFAKMPGTAYRCPNMRDDAITGACDKHQKNGNNNLKWICLVCHKEELDENGDIMICCDLCEDWYHLRCIGVPTETYPENMLWYCKRCMARQIRQGTFNPEKFPLFN